MRIFFLLTTAFSVSIDSFLCGLSLQAQYKEDLKMLLGITVSVFTLCFISGVCGVLVGNFLQNYANALGGIILYSVAIINSLPEVNSTSVLSTPTRHVFKKSLAVGIGVGLDGALACFSLTATGFNSVLVIILITLTHVITLMLAITLINVFGNANVKVIKIIPPFILAILGSIKIADFISTLI